MGRTRLIALLMGVCLLLPLLSAPSALAGTFSWSLPGDFTTTSPGSNPEHKYGAPSWSYKVDGSAFPWFDFSKSASPCGGAGYSDGSNCITDTGSQMMMRAAFGHSVTITWTNPFPTSQTMTVTNTISARPLSCVQPGRVSAPSGTITVAPGGTVSVTVMGGLPSCSASGTISITAATPGPAVTLDQPPGGVWIGRANLAFSGHAGGALGDSPTVTLYLYRGKSAGGSLAGQRSVFVQGSTWETTWPGLALGSYTVVAAQSDNAGHTTRTPVHTFRLVSHIRGFGSRVTVDRTGVANIPVGCLAPSGQTCRGTVLVVTKRSFRTAAGGPVGPLEVLFASVRIPGGTMGVIGGRVPSRVMAVLRRLRRVEVVVTAKLSRGGRKSVTRPLRIT